MKMYSDGKHDKLFKHGSVEENARKEAILRELNTCIARKNNKTATRNSASLLLGDSTNKDRASKMPLTAQKRRKLDSGLPAAPRFDNTQLEGESFRARVLELIESKIQFDMDQRIKETELREQEFELQKRFLEYLQSK